MPTHRCLTRTFILLFLLSVFNRCSQSDQKVLVITDTPLQEPVRYGLEKLEAALQEKGYQVERKQNAGEAEAGLQIFVGLATGDGNAGKRLRKLNITPPTIPESLVIHRENQSSLVLCGTDANGLLYALLEAAERIGWQEGTEPLFQHIENTVESPQATDRSLSIYTMHRKAWEDRLYDEHYWEKYFDQLARSRINSFVVIFGYENGGFLAPVYPYFFNVEEYPDVKLVGITQEEQQRNTAAFKRMIALAHERGIRFMPGIWDHIYRGGVQSGGVESMREVPDQPIPGLVWGLDADNLAGYTKAALKEFLDVFPEIDGIQFRMHWESGLTREETPRFWGEVFDMLEKEKPGLAIDLRTKGLPDEVIQDAIDKNLNFRLTTKYWMEQMGLPFHPVHINTQNQHDRRHGYADLLTYPQHYKMHWRLWNGGASRILLWGDPDYVRRFVESIRVYDGNSFEVNEPLATKMEAQPHDMEPFALLNPEYQYYEYEFERYWYFFQLWGRVSYNPDMSPVIFEKEFERRFGTAAGLHLREGLHLASKVLPRIIAATYRYRFFPTTRGWAEKMRMEDLPLFAQAEGSDIQLFASFAEEAEWQITGEESAKVLPSRTAKWFMSTADQILAAASEAEAANTMPSNKEFTSTVTDLKILAYLAQYYGKRIPAAISYNLYLKTGNLSALQQAIEQEQDAILSWEKIVASAGNIYTNNLRMGICHGNMCGHWQDELEKLQSGLQTLQSVKDSLANHPSTTPQRPTTSGNMNLAGLKARNELAPPKVVLSKMDPIPATAGRPLRIEVEATDPSGIKWVRLRYRHFTQFEDYQTLAMQYDSQKDAYIADIPGDFIVRKWDLMYFIEAMDNEGNGAMYPDFEEEMPYVIVQINREEN